jgi:ApbE superfamily uncharacterized protein (UPF0280 family)
LKFGDYLELGIWLLGFGGTRMPLTEKICRHDPVQALLDGTFLVDYGPMRMFISVSENGKPLFDLAEEGARLAMRVLEDLATFLPVIRKKSKELEIKGVLPEVVRRMIEAIKKMDELDLTPLAAVAGTAADVVADFIFSRGGTKIIVDNGGDVAIRLREGEVARVGIKTEIDAKQPAYFFTIDSTMGIGGVATSGLGGRSFTKGIASETSPISKIERFQDLWQKKYIQIQISLENGSR